jgi:shikimate 5-dehydrogenase
MLIFQALKSIDLWFDKNLSDSVNVEEFEKKLLKIIYGNKL